MKFKLTEIEIKNFLSYKYTKFSDLKNYNIIIGKNNSGKSNLLKVLKFIHDSIYGLNEKSISELISCFLYNSDKENDAFVSFTFQLSDDFRREIFKKLYNANYLNEVFKNNPLKELFTIYDDQKRSEISLNWMIKEGFLKKIKFTFAYYKLKNDLIIQQIAGIHEKFKNPIPLFIVSKEEKNDLFLHILNNEIQTKSNNFEEFFGSNIIEKSRQGYLGRSLKDTFNSLIGGSKLSESCDLIKIIIENFYEFFRNSIHYIPDKRYFEGEADTSDIINTILEPDGHNFVKYIYKKINTGEINWVNDFNKELAIYIPNIVEITQIIDRIKDKEKTILISKERGLKVDVRLEHMGMGVLNVAFFLAYLKEIKEGTILIIEEPELFIFPGLQTKIRDKFLHSSDKIQMFVSTHSPRFLIEDDSKCSVYSVQKTDGGSIAFKVPKEKFSKICEDLEVDLEEYEKQKSIKNDENFWRSFIIKVIEEPIENKLWDFKETLKMWKAPDSNEKRKGQIEFCEDIAGFANSEGGVLIVGITNKIPREIKGIEESLERKVQDCRDKILKWTDYDKDFFQIKTISLSDKKGSIKTCVIIIVAQTKEVIGVKQENEDYSYKIRLETGCKSFNRNKIKETKKNLYDDNYNFFKNLKEFCQC